MNTFRKEERLCSNKMIDGLFERGNQFVSYPLRGMYSIVELNTNFPVQVVFMVSKKKFKRAVKRNYIKRLMREAYRINKSILYNYLNYNNIKIIFAIQFISSDIPDYENVEKGMLKAFNKLIQEIETNKISK
jgi:ribonuclease P protein component